LICREPGGGDGGWGRSEQQVGEQSVSERRHRDGASGGGGSMMLERRADSDDGGWVSLLTSFGVCVCVVNSDMAGVSKVDGGSAAAMKNVHGLLRLIVPTESPEQHRTASRRPDQAMALHR